MQDLVRTHELKKQSESWYILKMSNLWKTMGGIQDVRLDARRFGRCLYPA